ncbi:MULTISPECIES: WhiB family transcriptional regulator [unclassified Mycolicibacterium]|uniref:WhiB family transcriptional regulator n=1 Tax=unclassified Mycolicibacterium TaxID=2636767 RepID=UPI001412AF15|nr:MULTISPECIES: WhiB family transcriptional regulator [unclassified Mycolicibacterium]
MKSAHVSRCTGETFGGGARLATRPRPRPGCHTRGAAITEAWDWQLHARCRGLPAEVFYTGDEDRGARRIEHEENAKQICGGCPVQRECLGHAIEADEPYGIWGATTPKERAALRQVSTAPGRA